MYPLSFTSSSTNDNLENFIEELNKVFNVMHVANVKRFELAAYQLKKWLDIGSMSLRRVE